MGQTELLNIIENKPNKWFSIDELKELANKQNGFTGNVWRIVNRLVAYELVETKLTKIKACRWGYKRVIKHKKINK
jgi:hypothetical protein